VAWTLSIASRLSMKFSLLVMMTMMVTLIWTNSSNFI